MEGLTLELLKVRVAAAREALRGQPAVLAFDGDGTLWSGDIGEDYFHAFMTHGDIRPPAVAAMRALRRDVGLDDGPDAGVAMARQLFDAYLRHELAEDTICEVIAWAAAGWREAEVAGFVADLHARLGMETRRRSAVVGMVEWGRAEGLEVFLVSASPRPIVEAAGAPLGFDAAHILAATAPFTDDGVMRAEVVRPIPYGEGKATLLHARTGGCPVLAAFGDNVFDVPMLALARVPVVVEPKPRLVALLEAGVEFAPVRLRVD